MKLISLNIWGGKMFQPLLSYISSTAPETDIFCFQEVFNLSVEVAPSHGARMHILSDLASTLPNFQCYFSSVQQGYDLEGPVATQVELGQAIFARKSLEITASGEVFVYLDHNLAQSIQIFPASFNYICFRSEAKEFTLGNLHEIAFPGNKLDTPERLAQSEKIKQFLSERPGAQIFCGDFNLLPETQSLKILEENMTNLIKVFHIPRTRSKENFKNHADDPQYFADYMLVSPEVKVISFEVPDVDVSDHLPLVLEFS